MAVIITDMKFPKRCLDCQLMGREKMYCQLHPRKNLNVVRVVSEKPEWCPLKEVSDSSVFEGIKAELKMLTSNRGFLSCNVDYIHDEIDKVFNKHMKSEDNK